MSVAIEPLDHTALLADLPLEQGGAHPLDPAGVSVRAYPYPYVAALTISNDLDSMMYEAFENWHAFVNGRGPTPDGDGLGLEIGDSFWIWDGHAGELLALHWQFPDEEPRIDSPRLDRIAELGRLGWLDTMHSLGNWAPAADESRSRNAHRDQVAYALDRLDRLGIHPGVYVNHSSSVSNVGGPWGWYQRADDPEHPFYCLDLLKAAGFKYFWPDVCISLDKFGDHLEYPSAAHLERALQEYIHWGGWLRYRDRGGPMKPLNFPGDADAHRHLLLSFFNRTLLRVTCRDGTPILAFKRHRGFDQPVMSTFCNQVTEADLDNLEALRGVAVVYQHFGLAGPRGRSPILSRPLRHQTRSPVFDVHAQSRLRDIAERFHAGRLWVALTKRVLDYLLLRESLRFDVAINSGRWVVTIADVASDAVGRRPIEDADLNGLSFSVPSAAPEIIVEVAGRANPLPMQRARDGGWEGRDAVFLPWTPLEWPD